MANRLSESMCTVSEFKEKRKIIMMASEQVKHEGSDIFEKQKFLK